MKGKQIAGPCLGPIGDICRECHWRTGHRMDCSQPGRRGGTGRRLGSHGQCTGYLMPMTGRMWRWCECLCHTERPRNNRAHRRLAAAWGIDEPGDGRPDPHGKE